MLSIVHSAEVEDHFSGSGQGNPFHSRPDRHGNFMLSGKTLNLRRLPRGFVVDGDLDLREVLDDIRLPDDLTVRGDVTFPPQRTLSRFPRNLRVAGDLNLRRCALKQLARGLKVEGSLCLEGSAQLRTLPIGLEVGGNLILTACRMLVALPTPLSVGGLLDLTDCTQIARVPRMVMVQGGFVVGKRSYRSVRAVNCALACRRRPPLRPKPRRGD